jgi:hypothetical protein
MTTPSDDEFKPINIELTCDTTEALPGLQFAIVKHLTSLFPSKETNICIRFRPNKVPDHVVIDKVIIGEMNDRGGDPERIVAAFNKGLKRELDGCKVASAKPIGFVDSTKELKAEEPTPKCQEDETPPTKALPFPEATKRKDYPEGLSIALLPDGTKVKYVTETGDEVERKLPDGRVIKVELAASHEPTIGDRAVAEYTAYTDTCNLMKKSDEIAHVQMASGKGEGNNFEIKLVTTDGERLSVPQIANIPVDESELTEVEFIETLQSATSVLDVVSALGPMVGNQRDGIVSWCIKNRTLVPALAAVPEDKLPVRIVRTLSL